jgi:capsular polysaccharide transport system permease protein
MQTLEQARATAAAQHLYITPYVPPTTPTSSTYPRRLSSVALFALYCFLGWVFLVLMYKAVRDHM